MSETGQTRRELRQKPVVCACSDLKQSSQSGKDPARQSDRMRSYIFHDHRRPFIRHRDPFTPLVATFYVINNDTWQSYKKDGLFGPAFLVAVSCRSIIHCVLECGFDPSAFCSIMCICHKIAIKHKAVQSNENREVRQNKIYGTA